MKKIHPVVVDVSIFDKTKSDDGDGEPINLKKLVF